MVLGGNLDGVRRRNLSSVLGLVHRSGTVSRAQLTTATGLNRSTIGALVAELVDLGLVVETSPEATNRVGRPSPGVAPHPAPVALAVNPEVDALTVGVVGLGARVEHRVRHEVDRVLTADETAALLGRLVADLRDGPLRGRRVLGVGLAVPGLVRAVDGLVRWAPHLDWRDAPIAELVDAELGLPTLVGNDASLGAVAEHVFGAGRAASDLVYLNGGASGIGGGVIVGGRLLGGAGGYAGEFGQNRPGVADAADRITADGTLEDEVSRARLLAAVGLDAADEPALAAAVLASGDDRVVGELARQRRILATALSNAVNVLDPELVLLGGFLSTVLASDPAGLERLVVEQAVPSAAERVRIRPAGLGGDLLMIGAAELVFERLIASPSRRAEAPTGGLAGIS